MIDQLVKTLTLEDVLVLTMAAWGFYKVVMEIIGKITSRHDKEQEWSKTKEELEKDRQEIMDKYDNKLSDMKKTIEENHCDTEAKIQELKADMLILTRSVSAVLDGLKQQGCNGAVTKAKEELDSFLMDKAYD